MTDNSETMNALYLSLGISGKVLSFAEPVLQSLSGRFEEIDRTAEYNQLRIIRVCDIPWGPRAYNPTDPQALYSAYILDHYPIAKAPVPRSASATEALFRQGGVIIANPGGHYVLAVGGAYGRLEGNDGDQYIIHIVDSSCQSTWWRTNQNHGSVLYDFNGLGVIQGYRREEGRPVDGAVGGRVMSKWSGGEYWAPFSVFSRYRLDRAFVPGEGPFGGMP